MQHETKCEAKTQGHMFLTHRSDSCAERKFQFNMKIFTIDLLSTRQPAMFYQVNLEMLEKLSISLIVKHVARQKAFCQTNRVLYLVLLYLRKNFSLISKAF